MFHHLSNQRTRPQWSTMVLSFVVHGLVISALLLVPLLYFQHLPQDEFVAFLTGPVRQAPPPPPPPAAPPKLPKSAVEQRPHIFAQPREIPEDIPAPSETPEIRGAWPYQGSEGTPGNAVAIDPSLYSQVGISTVELPTVSPPPPPPPPPAPKIVKRGGIIQSAKLVHRVDPQYPELAERARVQGSVILQALVDEEGWVKDLKVIEGHPLLSAAALKAVRQWHYSPTLLNGEPVQVVTTITVRFKLN